MADRLQDALRNLGGVRDRPGVVEDHREFIAPEAGRRVALPQTLEESRRDGLQQRIAGGMSQRVVDVLEIVKVDHHHREIHRGTAGTHEALDSWSRNTTLLLNPVRGVMERLLSQSLLQFVALGDIVVGHDVATLLGHPTCQHIDVVDLPGAVAGRQRAFAGAARGPAPASVGGLALLEQRATGVPTKASRSRPVRFLMAGVMY